MSKHRTTGKDVGQWEGSTLSGRYWTGGCLCGSGKEGHEVYDSNGIYFGISCGVCKREPQPGPYDEPIDED